MRAGAAPGFAELTAFAERGGFEVLGIFKETASGARDNRLARNRVLELAQARRIDAVLVTELSRWGRSTQDLLKTLYKLAGCRGRHERHDVRVRHASRTDDGHDAGGNRSVRK